MTEVKFSCLGINVDLIDRGGAEFVSRLQEMSSHCMSMSKGEIYSGGLQQPLEILSYMPARVGLERQLLLVLPYDKMLRYSGNSISDEQKIREYNDGTIFSDSVGHCYTTWDKKIDICGIWDVCLHKQYLGKKRKGFLQNWGSLLVENILNYLNLSLPNSECTRDVITQQIKCVSKTMLWLGIDLTNVHFSNVVYLYTKFGFSNPFVSFIDPFGANWNSQLPRGFLSLSRSNDFYLPEDINRTYAVNEVIYVIQQYLKNPSLASTPAIDVMIGEGHVRKVADYGYCGISFRFNDEYAKIFSKFPMGASSFNADGSVTQKEVAGMLVLSNPTINYDIIDVEGNKNKPIIWEVSLNRDSRIFGEETQVSHVAGKYSFHTHPRDTYDKKWFVPMANETRNVTMGYPSPGDYKNLLLNTLTLNLGFHIVMSVEGIYVLCLHKVWLLEITRLIHEIYPASVGSYTARGEPNGIAPAEREMYISIVERVMNTYWGWQFPGMTPTESGKEYARLSSTLRALGENNQPVFNVQFFTWDEVLSGIIINIDYPIIDGVCFPTQNALETFHRLYPNAPLNKTAI